VSFYLIKTGVSRGFRPIWSYMGLWFGGFCKGGGSLIHGIHRENKKKHYVREGSRGDYLAKVSLS